MLLSGEMTVTGLSRIEPICRPENTEAILEKAAGCSCRELDILRARHCPSEPKPEKVKPVFVKTEIKIKSETSTGGKKFTANTEGSNVLEEKYRLEFSVSAEAMNKIKRAKSLLSTKYPKEVKLETLLEELLDNYLNNNDPERREDHNNIKLNKLERTRYIPQKIKDLVYRRDGERCSFISKNGRRCGSTWNLQYDHIVPFGKGGYNSPENLRLLCGRHNQLRPQREYAKEHIGKFCGDNG